MQEVRTSRTHKIEKDMTSEVHNIDCLEYMRTLPDNYFQLAIADPPYRDENAPFQQMRKASSEKVVFTTGRPTQEFFDELKRVSKEQVLFGANNFGYEFKGFIAWDKMVRGSDRYSQVEIASLSEGLATVSTLLQISTYQTEDKIHPTQKPVALYAWLLQHYAKDGDRIFDPMMGSQSSRIAAYKLGFDYVGCELDKEYFDKGCERFDRECHGIVIDSKGQKIQQQTLF